MATDLLSFPMFVALIAPQNYAFIVLDGVLHCNCRMGQPLLRVRHLWVVNSENLFVCFLKIFQQARRFRK